MKQKQYGLTRFIAVFVVVHIFAFSCHPVLAASSDSAAQILYDLGLVLGTGKNSEGLPEFSLEEQMTRNEAVVLLVRMLGAEQLAMFNDYVSPFVDVPIWAKNHVGYAYMTGITKGASETLFDGESYIDQNQFCALVLRALGYSDKEDFIWNQSASFAQSVGLISAPCTFFTREDAFNICYNALLSKVKSSQMTLLQILVNADVVDVEQLARHELTPYQVPLHYFSKHPEIPSALNIYPNITLKYEFDDSETREFLSSIGVEADDQYSETFYYHFDCHSLKESEAVASMYSKFLEAQGFTFLISEDQMLIKGENIQYALLTPDQSYIVIIQPESDGMMSVQINKFSNKYPVLYYKRYTTVPDYAQVGNSTELVSNSGGVYVYSGYQNDTYYAALLAKSGFINADRTADDVISTKHIFVNTNSGISVSFGQGRVEIRSGSSESNQIN